MKGIFTPSIFILILIFIAAGCKKEDATNNNTCIDGSTNFPFLATGHKTSYHVLSTEGEDTMTYIIGPDSSGIYTANITYVHNWIGATNINYWWACDKNLYENVWFYPGDGWFFSLNSNVGDSWTRNYGGNINDYQLLSKSANVTTSISGQTFTNCYEFSVYIPGNANVDTIYFQPDVGEVYFNGYFAKIEMISRNY